MKLLPFVAVLGLAMPVSAAANVAIDVQQAAGSGEAVQAPPAGAGAHHPLFIVKYVLRRAPSETPSIVMDDAGPQIVPPGKDFPAATLGGVAHDPNTIVCHGWGCQHKP
ncbi:hypothetical protein [Frateuria soli]|uniref:hypothetical protein n=1 Tax=Frateuria soli TaxID=1542730 RepID=UPI001E36F434|nr:hypothetical protein [Frateuria soli]UGB39269.1 hypothetical protein LQ771_05330 [Frateuria soli]